MIHRIFLDVLCFTTFFEMSSKGQENGIHQEPGPARVRSSAGLSVAGRNISVILKKIAVSDSFAYCNPVTGSPGCIQTPPFEGPE